MSMQCLSFSTVYKGFRTSAGRGSECRVAVYRGKNIERFLSPGPSLSIFFHSHGFEWGYGGSGPAQLALALLFDFTSDRETSRLLYQRFKADYIAGFDEAGFSISGAEIGAWILKQHAIAQEQF